MTSNSDTSFFGHPRGLAALFFTEMWERFSYYGIRALLILYMTAAAPKGLGLDVPTAGALYGLFTGCAYIFALPGGWIGDRFLGAQRSVLVGGVLIALGNFALMTPSLAVFLPSLLVIAMGTGLLKTNATSNVGVLYAAGDVRRDAGFSIYYFGVNLGAGIAPLICGYVGQLIDFRYAFGLAGICMMAGVAQFTLTRKGGLGEAGLKPVSPAGPGEWRMLRLGAAALVLTVAAVAGFDLSIARIADGFGVILIVTVVAVFAGLLLSPGFTKQERGRIVVVGVLFVASSLFWSIFEQAGSTLNLFADRSTDNSILGWQFPSSYFQSLNSIFLYALTPFFVWLWVKLGDRNPSPVVKFAVGLFGAAGGFFVMAFAALAAGEGKVSPLWLTGCYFLHTIGELCLSPVGLSAMTKLAPPRIAGFVMGVFFLSISVGNYMGGRLSAFYESFPLSELFGYVGGFGLLIGLVLLAASKPITRQMGGVK
jgi:POT family proton-dependent oligopeptide transporter